MAPSERHRPLLMLLAVYAALALFALPTRAAPSAGADRLPPVLDYDRHLHWSIKVDSAESAQRVATSLGLTLQGRVGGLDTHFLVSSPKPVASTVAVEPTVATDGAAGSEFDSTSSHKLRKRAALDGRDALEHPHTRLHARTVEAAIADHDAVIAFERQVPEWRLFKRTIYTEQDMQTNKQSLGINDPGFDSQWHLYNKDKPRNDLNVTGVWLHGVTGKGVTVALVDDGLDYNHQDLKDAFEPRGSYDFNDHDPLPRPRLYDDYHGTRCAAEVAAKKGNSVCGIGVAYDARVSGIRILSGQLSRADEAAAYTYGMDVNDIYSCSFGPADDGQTVDGPSPIVREAFAKGVAEGRGGLGALYVFASGNGGRSQDNCNNDGYANSLHTITIGAIDRNDQRPWYSEVCAAQLAVTYSGNSGSPGIFTADVGTDKCTSAHSGTSAAAPLAAGVLALVLSVRPDLSWRDVQRLIVETAMPFNVAGNVVEPGVDTIVPTQWMKLPSGRYFSHNYGYGVLDAFAIVEAAKRFQKLPVNTTLAARDAVVSTNQTHWSSEWVAVAQKLKAREALTSLIDVSSAATSQIARLEHVTVTVTIKARSRGDILVDLISPNKVLSMLATKRLGDTDPSGYQNWTFSSVQHWDENPVGTWTLRVSDAATSGVQSGEFVGWSLTLFGEDRIHPPSSTQPEQPPPVIASPPVKEPAQNDTLPVTVPANDDTAVTTPSAWSGLLPTMMYMTLFGLIIASIGFAYRRRQRRNLVGAQQANSTMMATSSTGAGWKLHKEPTGIQRWLSAIPVPSFLAFGRGGSDGGADRAAKADGFTELSDEQMQDVMGTFLDDDEDDDQFDEDDDDDDGHVVDTMQRDRRSQSSSRHGRSSDERPIRMNSIRSGRRSRSPRSSSGGRRARSTSRARSSRASPVRTQDDLESGFISPTRRSPSPRNH
ncbi:pheromone processing endoprotease [Sorochytrium milnesiophthora]